MVHGDGADGIGADGTGDVWVDLAMFSTPLQIIGACSALVWLGRPALADVGEIVMSVSEPLELLTTMTCWGTWSPAELILSCRVLRYLVA